MNQTILIKETLRLAQAANQALTAIGCIHRLKNNTGTKALPVPLERTRYDPDTGLLWVEINPQRLPRGFSFSRLCEEGFQEKVVEIFHRRVVLMQYGSSIIIASLLNLPSRKSDILPMAVS